MAASDSAVYNLTGDDSCWLGCHKYRVVGVRRDGVSINLATYTAAGKIRSYQGQSGTELAVIAATVTDAANGLVEIHITPTELAKLPRVGLQYPYTVTLTPAAPSSTTPFYFIVGDIELKSA